MIIKINFIRLKQFWARFLLAIIPVILFFTLPGVSFADKEPETGKNDEQIKQIEQDLMREKEKYEKFNLKEMGLLEQLAEMEKVIVEKRMIVQQIRDELSLSRRELKEHQDRLEDLEKNLANIEDLLAKRLVAYYKYAKRGYLKILASTEGFDQLNHNMKYLRVIMDNDREIMERLAYEQSNYRQEVSSIQEKLAAVAELEDAEKSRLESLNDDLENKVILLSKVHKEKEFYETAVKELESAAKNLKNTIVKLDKVKTVGSELPSGFENEKGRLPLPLISGKIKRKQAGENSFASHKGIYIEGQFGADIRAVFPGRVDYSGQLKGYGQVIVLNHGERYFTIYAFLLHSDRTEGEIVSGGDLLGQVGESDLVTGPALYFEIRNGDKTLDPLKWLKVN